MVTEHVSRQDIGSILDHYADVIEGGNAYNSGTEFNGIPGRYSNDKGLLSGDDSEMTAVAAGSTTTVVVSSAYSWPQSRWVRDHTPGFFLMCTSGAADAVNKARRITGWNNTTKTFTTDAFPVAPGDAATFDVMHGFKRVANGVDINEEDVGIPEGQDRVFDLSLEPGSVRSHYGNGVETWDGRLVIKLRLLKNSRLRDIRRSMAENINIIATSILGGRGYDFTDGVYIRALFYPDSPPSEYVNDDSKIVAFISMPILYRIQRGL